ncbi:MAG: DUF1571 domain-containing protein [Gemmataceae bacterium]
MRNDTWKRKWIASLLGGLSITAGVRAGDDKPPPYPSISPILPAISAKSSNPTVPTPVTPDVKPASGIAPDPTSIPTPVVPKIETPVLPKVDQIALPQVPTIPAAKPAEKPITPPTVPSITPPTVKAPTTPTVTPTVTPAVLPPVVTPPVTETKSIVTSNIPPADTQPKAPVVTPTTATTPTTNTVTPSVIPRAGNLETVPPVTTPTVPSTQPSTAAKPATRSTVNVSIGATPGVLDNTSKVDTMLAESKEAYMKVHDYSCHFIKQERLKGKLTPEVIFELHARTVPFAIYSKAVQPKEFAGFESVYVAGRFATDQIRVKPNGGAYMTVSTTDPRAMSGRHSADQVGIGAVLAMLDKQVGMERKLGNPITVTISDFTYASRPVIRYELLCDKPHANRYSHRTVAYFDKETKLPVRIEAYDEPRSGGSVVGDLLESYSFVNIKTNVGHSSAVFDR